MYKTNILSKIENLVREDVKDLLRRTYHWGHLSDEEGREIIRKYRDANFLSGSYDHIFDEMINNITDYRNPLLTKNS